MEGRAATAKEMEWLIRRSLGVGLPSPQLLLTPHEGDTWETDDLHAFADDVDHVSTPLGRTTKVLRTTLGRRHRAACRRHVRRAPGGDRGTRPQP